MTSIEAAIAASMELGKIVYPEYIEAVVRVGDNLCIITSESIIVIPTEAFQNYITDWLDALIVR